MNLKSFFGVVATTMLQLTIIEQTTAQSWTQHPLPGAAKNLLFNAVACSADGNQIVAAGGGSTFAGTILISSDFGNTWRVTSAPAVYWLSVASSADGKRVVAVGSDTATTPGIYTSSDSGTNWTPGIPIPAYGVACSSNGLKMVAVKYAGSGPYAGSIYLSIDGGASWHPSPAPMAQTNSFSWVTSSADGDKLAAVGGLFNKTYLYTSGDAGQSWVQANVPAENWITIASSADGNKLVACAIAPNHLYTSADSGATWHLQTGAPNEEWGSVASSYDGRRLVAAGGAPFGQIYTSTDAGVSWYSTNNAPRGLTGTHPPVGWYDVASSADGLRLVGAPSDAQADANGIYTLEWLPLSTTVTATPERIHTGEQIQVLVTTTNLDINTLTNVQIAGPVSVTGDTKGIHVSLLSGSSPASVALLAPGATATFTNVYTGTNYGTALFTARTTGTGPNGAEFGPNASSSVVRIAPDGDLLIKRDAEAASLYAGHGVFQTVAAPPQVKGNVVDTNEDSIFEVQIRNDDPLPQTFGILAVHAGNQGWQRTYSLNGANVTTQLESASGASLPMALPEMAPGDSMTLGITMRATNAPANSSQIIEVLLGLVSNPTLVLDTVEAVSHLGALSLTGTVYCVCNSNAVPGAKIRIGTNSFTSDAYGAYSWTNIPPGDYTVTVTAINYEDYTNILTVDGTQTVVTNDIYLTNANPLTPRVTQPSSFTYDNFSSANALQLNGSAIEGSTADGRVMELTPVGTNQAGSAFTANPVVLDANGSFATFFTFRVGQIGSTPGAGMTFTLQSVLPSSLGQAGSGLGYVGISNSLAVSFNPGTNGTLLGNRIAVKLNGSINEPVSVSVTNAPLNNGSVWYCWIDYDGTCSLLEVRLSDKPVRPAMFILSAILNLPGVLGANAGPPLGAYVGFTGSGGSQQDILSWKFMGLPITRFTGRYTLTNVSANYRLTNGIAFKLYTYALNGVTYTNAYAFQEQLSSHADGTVDFQTEAEATPVVGSGGEAESELLASLTEYTDVSGATPTTGVATPVTTPVPVGQTFEQSFPGLTESQVEGLIEGLSVPPQLPAPPTDLNQAIELQTQVLNELTQYEQYRHDAVMSILGSGQVVTPPPNPLLNQLSQEQQTMDQINQQLQVEIQLQTEVIDNMGSYSTATDVGTLSVRQQMISGPPPILRLLSPQATGTNISFGLLTANNLRYTIWSSTNAASLNWVVYTNFVSDGYPKTITAPSSGSLQTYYRASSP